MLPKNPTIDIILLQSFGDVLEGTIIVHTIKEKYPSSYIRFHTMKQYLEVVDNNPEIDEVIPTASYLETYDWINSNSRKSDHICKLAMANQFDTYWHHNQDTYKTHMIDWYCTRTGLDLTIRDYNVRIYPTSCDIDDSKLLTSDLDRYIIMHTTSLLESKNWPIQYFNHLARMLKKKYEMEIVQIGGSSDVIISNVRSILGLSNARTTAAVINKATMYIGIDSGAAYIAGASGIPTFLIMGATSGIDPNGSRVGPIGKNIHYIEPTRPNDPHCKPVCVNHCALNSPCINTVLPDIVMKRIEEVLN